MGSIRRQRMLLLTPRGHSSTASNTKSSIIYKRYPSHHITSLFISEISVARRIRNLLVLMIFISNLGYPLVTLPISMQYLVFVERARSSAQHTVRRTLRARSARSPQLGYRDRVHVVGAVDLLWIPIRRVPRRAR